MAIKRIGKAKLDLKTETWGVAGQQERYLNNRRLVDQRPEVKTLHSQYARIVRKDSPLSKRERKDQYQAELRKLLIMIYEEIRQESFQFPIPLRKDYDYDHHSDWRYSLYQGIIYQLDRPNMHDDDVLEQIRQLEGKKLTPSSAE